VSLEYNEKNLMHAWCKTLACTKIGQAENPSGCAELQPKEVKKTVPEPMQDAYPTALHLCAIRVCTNKPYLWQVASIMPEIDDTTTFEELFADWFTIAVRPT